MLGHHRRRQVGNTRRGLGPAFPLEARLMDAFNALRDALRDGAMLTRDQAHDVAQRIEQVLGAKGYAVLPATPDACIMRESDQDRSTLRIRGLSKSQARDAIDIIMRLPAA